LPANVARQGFASQTNARGTGNYETQALVKSFETPATNDSQPMPVRYAKFVPRKQWIIAGTLCANAV